jgi:predicted phosphodiesterase
MRIAILADIHGNLTALEAVLADLRQKSRTWFITAATCLTEGRIPPR